MTTGDAGGDEDGGMVIGDSDEDKGGGSSLFQCNEVHSFPKQAHKTNKQLLRLGFTAIAGRSTTPTPPGHVGIFSSGEILSNSRRHRILRRKRRNLLAEASNSVAWDFQKTTSFLALRLLTGAMTEACATDEGQWPAPDFVTTCTSTS